MTRLSHGVLGANQHAVRVSVENVSTVIPACNIDLDQPGQWAAYFEFGITQVCTVHKAGALRHYAYTCAFNRFNKLWYIEERKVFTIPATGERAWRLVSEYRDNPDNFAEAVYAWGQQPLSWFTPRFGPRYEKELVDDYCGGCLTYWHSG